MKIKLEKLYKPDFDELYRMISELKNFLKEKADMDNDEWKENLDIMLEFHTMMEASSLWKHSTFHQMQGLTSATCLHTYVLQFS